MRTHSFASELAACLLLLGATSSLSACISRVEDSADESVRRTSSGPALGVLFRIGDESSGDTILFGGIGELVAVDRAGRIFVGEEQDPVIYVFTADGSLVRIIGQKGSGPGEFQRLESIHSGPGDTLYAFDSQLDRISAYEPYSLSLAYDFAVSGDSLGLPSGLVGVLDTGLLVTYGRPVSPNDYEKERRRYVLRVDWSGRVLPPPVHYLPDYEWHFSVSGEMRQVIRLPFARDPVFRMGTDGSLYAGWSGSVGIAVIAPDGSHSRAITRAHVPVPVTRNELERFAENTPAWYRSSLLEVDLPEGQTKSAFETFVVDDRARIWLKTTPRSVVDSTAQWLILDAESQLRGQVELPVNTNLRTIRGDRAYAVGDGDEITLIVYQVKP